MRRSVQIDKRRGGLDRGAVGSKRRIEERALTTRDCLCVVVCERTEFES